MVVCARSHCRQSYLALLRGFPPEAIRHARRNCKLGAGTLAEAIRSARRRWQLGAGSHPERVTLVAVYILIVFHEE